MKKRILIRKDNDNPKSLEQYGRNWREKAGKLLLLLYPSRCPFCDEILDRKEQKDLCCRKCRTKIPWVFGPVCMKCGKPLKREEEEYCPDCLKIQHVFDQGAAVFTYSGCIPGSIFRLKTSNRRDYVPFYAEALYRIGRRHLKRWQPQAVLPVPMHPLKKAARGYNQSELLAREFCRKAELPYEPDLMVCIKKTKVQKYLGQNARRKNLRGSYAVKKNLNGLHTVLVIDDVYTTGSTMDEIARILKKAGVRHVYFLVLCTGKGKNSVCMTEKV